MVCVSPTRSNSRLLQHAQQFDLQLGRGGVDFVEKDCAGVGGFETAGAIGSTAPVNAPRHVAKEFAFQQAFGQRPAIDAHKRPSCRAG